ncbi:MAG TPA: hypothetical protein VFZ65_07630 [Planctomycetota bacterium]|nr:hypothetical protein [Planctomycetota bacterium]
MRTHAMPFPLLATLLLVPGAAGQEPAVQAPDGARLVYEMPMDALQRTLRDNPDTDLERLLERSVRTIALRVGEQVRVRRHEATGFVVDVPAELTAQLPALRRRIAARGTFEMRMVADGDYRAGDVHFDLAAEKKRLRGWFDDGGRERLLADPSAIDAFHAGAAQGPAAGRNLRWFVRRIRPDPRAQTRWSVALSQVPGLRDAAVLVNAEADWNGGMVPQHVLSLPEDARFLLEAIAVNMHETHFANADFDARSMKRADGGRLSYSIVDARRVAFSDFTAKYTRRGSCAVIWNDEVRLAVPFFQRLSGTSTILGAFTDAELDDVARLLQSGPLPAPPALLAENRLPASEFARAAGK